MSRNKGSEGYSFGSEGRSLILSESCKLYLVSTHSLTLDDLNKAKGKAKEKAKAQIKEMILSHLSELCGSDSDPVYLTKFSEMSLEELSTIIRPEKESPYCYTADTIRKLTDKTSPITRKPLQSWVLDIAENPSLMIRGFLPLGSIPGLMQVSDFKQIDTKPVDGELIMDSLSGLNGPDGLNLKETVIQIKMPNGDLVDFMELNTILLEPDFQLLVDLWNKGYFLNIWGTITNTYLKKLDLPGGLKFDPMLYLGKGTSVQVAEVIDRIRYTTE